MSLPNLKFYKTKKALNGFLRASKGGTDLSGQVEEQTGRQRDGTATNKRTWHQKKKTISTTQQQSQMKAEGNETTEKTKKRNAE